MFALFGSCKLEKLEIIKPGMNVVIIPFAADLEWQISGDMTEYKNNLLKQLYDLGVNEDRVYFASLKDKKRFIKYKLDNADVIFMTGGDPERLYNILEWMDINLNDYKDKHILGESAGALVMSDYYFVYPTPEEPQYKKLKLCKGFGLIKKLTTIVHYHKGHDKYIPRIRKIFNGKLLILKDGEFSIIDNDNKKS